MNGDIRPPQRTKFDSAQDDEEAQPSENDELTDDIGTEDEALPPASSAPTTQPDKPAKSSKTGLWITLALIAGLLIGGAVGYYLYQDQDSQNQQLQQQIDDLNTELQNAKQEATDAANAEKDAQIEQLQQENEDLKKQLEEAQSGDDNPSDDTGSGTDNTGSDTNTE